MSRLISILILASLPSVSFAGVKFGCWAEPAIDNEATIEIKGDRIVQYETSMGQSGLSPEPTEVLSDGSATYDIWLGDWSDTNIWFVLTIKDEKIISAEEWISGNDSDNYYGNPTGNPVNCKRL